jgi:hypothetical protein
MKHRATLSHTTRENTLGTRMNTTILTGKTGTKRLKLQLVTLTTSQEQVFLEERLMDLCFNMNGWVARNPILFHMTTLMSNRAISSHMFRETTHGTLMNTTNLTGKTSTRRLKTQLVTLTTSQEQAFLAEKLKVLWFKLSHNLLHRTKIMTTNGNLTLSLSHIAREIMLGTTLSMTTSTSMISEMMPPKAIMILLPMKSPIQPTFLIFSHQIHLKNVRKMPQLP